MNFSDMAAVVPAEGERQAALLLHALQPSDRAWLLGQLEASQRERLGALQAELADLGIPADPVWLTQVPGQQQPAKAAEVPGSGDAAGTSDDEAFLARLAPEGVSALADALRSEPPQFVASCLQCGPWPWKRELLGQLSAQQRMLVAEALRDGAQVSLMESAPSLAKALLAAMRAAVDAAGGAEGAPKPLERPRVAARSSGWQGLVARLLRKGQQ